MRYTLTALKALPHNAPVSKVALALDEDIPGWESRIDLETLDMRSVCNCVAGQLASKWAAPGTWSASTNGYDKFMQRLGISLKAFAGVPQLKAHWVRAIHERLAAR